MSSKVFFIVSSLIWASASFSVFGQVLNVSDAEGLALPGAKVVLFSVESDARWMAATDSAGNLELGSFPQAVYPLSVEVSYLGYLPGAATLSSPKNLAIVLETDPIQVGAVVVTGQYGQGRASGSPHRVKVISRAEIEAQGAVTLRDVLQFQPNIRLSQDNILGSSLQLQGMGGQNVKILVDGVPMIGRQDGNLDLSQINLNNIERIEIVEGPLSVNYGSDALAGTINLITRKEVSGKVEAGLNSYYESAGQYNLDGKLGLRLGKQKLQVTGGRNYFDGWSPDDPFFQFPKSRPADSLRVKSWNPRTRHFGKVQYQHTLKNIEIRPFGEVFQEEMINRGYPRAPYGVTAFDDTYRTLRLNGGVDYQQKIGEDGNLRILAAANFFERKKNTWRKDLTTLEAEPTADASAQDTTRFQLFMSRGTWSSHKKERKFNYQLGYEVQHETGTGRRLADGRQEQGDYAAFASAQIQPGANFLIRPGLRYGYNTAYSAPLVPSIHLKWQKQKTSLRASWARGFRAPSLKEQYLYFVDVNHNITGNPDLEAEYSHNFNLNGEWKTLQKNSLWTLSGGAHFNDIHNLITLAQQTGTAFSYTNVGRFQSLGARAEIRYFREALDLQVGAAFIGRRQGLESLPEDFAFSPEITTQARWTLPRSLGRLNLFYKFNGPLPSIIEEDGELYTSEIAGYHTLDLSWSKTFWKERIRWQVGGKNLLNVKNVNVISGTSGGAHSGGSNRAVSWGRTVFTALNIQWHD